MIKIISIFKLLISIIWTILIIIVTMVALILTWYPKGVLKIVSDVWAPMILWFMGVELKIEGLENIEKDKNYIFISNHTSYLDIPILLAAIPKIIYFVSKKELRRVPFFGWMMWALGMIFIDRKNKKRSIRSMKIAAMKLKSGKNVLVFPEGTFDDNGAFLPFKKGAFHIAVKSKTPVLPIGISGANQVWSGGDLLGLKKGIVTVRFGEVISQELEDNVAAINNLRDKSELAVKALI